MFLGLVQKGLLHSFADFSWLYEVVELKLQFMMGGFGGVGAGALFLNMAPH